MTNALLEARGVSLRFGGVKALSGVEFTVREGEIFSIIGPNGAGKTTLFDCISGRYVPEGSIRMSGKDLTGMEPHLRPGLGIMRTFQNVALFPSESVIDNVLVGLEHRLSSGLFKSCLFWSRWGCKREEEQARCEAMEALTELGLEKYSEMPVSDLSYGIQKRVELARVLVARPSLVLLDEPMAGMTTVEKKELAGEVVRLNRERGVTVVMSEHDIGVVMEISDRVMVLDFGCLIAIGDPASVMANPDVRKAYLGEVEQEHRGRWNIQWNTSLV